MPPKKKRESAPKKEAVQELEHSESEPEVTETAEPEPPKQVSLLTGEPYGPRIRLVSEKAEEESSDDEPEYLQEDHPEVPSEFWHIQKLIKYMKAGNQTATMVSLCLLKDYDLTDKNGSLSVLLQIATSTDMKRYLIDLDITTPLIQMLKHPARDIQILAAETMAIIARVRKARKQIRIRGGIPLILDVMDVPDEVLRRSYDELSEASKELVAVAIGCAKVLDSLGSSPKVKEELRQHGVVRLMSRFLRSKHTQLIVPTMGVVQQCADLNVFREAFERVGIINDLVRHLKNDNTKLKENSALAIFKCASNRETRTMVRRAGGLDPLCKLVQSDEVHANKRLLAAVTGGIWKCAISPENIMRFNQNDLVASLVPLLEENEDERVLANVVGGLAECCKDSANRDILRTNEGLPKLRPLQIRLLSATYEPLLENVPLVLKECAVDERCMDIINDPEHRLDGVRLVWSLLKHPSDVIKRNACLALVPCIRHSKDSPEMVRAFVGGLELTVSLLESKDTEVLSAVCAMIAEIATDPENLGILTDHGVVKKLAALVETDDENLRANLTLAIAYCCDWDRNSYEFGKLNAVAPLVNYMISKNKDVLKGVCIAVYHLSKEPLNCVTMHTCGVIKHVLRLVGSDDPEVQIAAASTIRHIRKLALTAEKFHFNEM
ncbi:Armadillo repeat-containing protein 4 [Temnothorax longispinosus]|uniref:Armadillo repeat-containing protein 4 n=1 Tax=Temnothorax longispinosus TaxID=300112 RepID=A0A4S2KX62_9HYME|nr:Armadillo repeat-containing protein 4 [Temnothorax longispinosus]